MAVTSCLFAFLANSGHLGQEDLNRQRNEKGYCCTVRAQQSQQTMGHAGRHHKNNQHSNNRGQLCFHKRSVKWVCKLYSRIRPLSILCCATRLFSCNNSIVWRLFNSRSSSTAAQLRKSHQFSGTVESLASFCNASN